MCVVKLGSNTAIFGENKEIEISLAALSYNAPNFPS